LIKNRIASLQRFPLIAPYDRSLRAHVLTVPGHPYLVYYELQGDEVWILHVRHGARRPLNPDDL
jgi:plasmid stabilization system protein ParE